jgi:hypothetical protein
MLPFNFTGCTILHIYLNYYTNFGNKTYQNDPLLHKKFKTASTSKIFTTFGCLISFIVEISLFSCQNENQQGVKAVNYNQYNNILTLRST